MSIAAGEYTTGVKSDKGHTARWSAPEVLFGQCTASKQADMFAFAMVVLEVRAPSRGSSGRDQSYSNPWVVLVFFIGVHWECAFLSYYL